MHWLLVIWLLVGTVAVPVSAAERSAGGDEGGITASGVVSITTFNRWRMPVTWYPWPSSLMRCVIPATTRRAMPDWENRGMGAGAGDGRLTEHWPGADVSVYPGAVSADTHARHVRTPGS